MCEEEPIDEGHVAHLLWKAAGLYVSSRLVPLRTAARTARSDGHHWRRVGVSAVQRRPHRSRSIRCSIVHWRSLQGGVAAHVSADVEFSMSEMSKQPACLVLGEH